MHKLRALISMALALLASGGAAAQSAGDPVQERLYQDALQAIAEGRRNDASDELRRLIDKEPLHAGAWLELAMTQCAIGHADEAERLFAVIETRFSPSPAMLQLIAETREEGCDRWEPRVTFSTAFGRGIDQNVNQGASTPNYIVDTPTGVIEYALSADFRPRHDQYSTLTSDFTRELTSNGSVGFVQYYGRRNDRLHQYDSSALYAGMDTPWRLGRWIVHTTGSVGAVTLGGEYYQRQLQLQARINPPLPLPAGMQFTLVTGASKTDFITLKNFDSNTYELRGLLAYRKEGWYASTSLGRLDDRASAMRPGGSRSGWHGNLVVRHALGPIGAELGYTYQSWNSAQVYSPEVIDIARRQATQILRTTLTWPLGKNQAVQLEARAVRNRENISIFEYNNRQLQLSWQWQGF